MACLNISGFGQSVKNQNHDLNHVITEFVLY